MTSIGIIGSEGRMGVALAAAISEAGQRAGGVDKGGNVAGLVRASDVVEVREKSRKVPVITEAQEVIARRGCPAWLESDGAAFKGTVKALPTREDIQFPINEQLIVELYSK